MFDFDPTCDCGHKVVDNIWPCKHCGRPDPRNCLNRPRLEMRVLKKRQRPKYGPEISFVFNPYIPEKKP